uniref:Uncharacterized protein n=1 Tax=Arcella intermedia TaxID=1963864 RepID=A0A6B2LKE9_9EUKA
METVKCVVVGEAGVGKTSLLITFSTNIFPKDYLPTIFEGHGANIPFDGKTISLSLWDTAGQEEYDRLRPLSYPQTNVFVLLFAVDNPFSFENVSARWHPELSHHCPGVPIVLAGTKTDLRRESISPITFEQGEDMMRAIGAVKYVECSALDQVGVGALFDEATRAAISASRTGKKKGGGCVFI